MPDRLTNKEDPKGAGTGEGRRGRQQLELDIENSSQHLRQIAFNYKLSRPPCNLDFSFLPVFSASDKLL